MPVIYDEDQSVDHGNAAEEEQRRLTNLANRSHSSEADDSGQAQNGSSEAEGHGKEGGDGLFNATKDKSKTAAEDKTSEKGGLRSKWKDTKSQFGQRAGKLLKNKWFLGVGIGGGSLAGMIILLLVFLSAFQIPHLMENITGYQFARVFSRMQDQNKRSISTKIATAAASTSQAKKINDKYGKYMDKVNKWSPSKQMALLQSSDQMKFTYKGKRLTSITLSDGTEIKPQTKFFKGLIPGYNFVKNQQASRVFTSELQIALRANEVGPITRGKIYQDFRKQLGISRVAWKAGQFKGKSKEEVRLAVEAETSRRTAKPIASTSSMDSDKNATKEIAAAHEAELDDPEKLKQTIANGGVSKTTQDIMDNVRAGSAFQTGVSALNDAYAIAAPICIVYEGSMSKSGETVDANSSAQISAGNNLATVSDQIKDGNTMDPVIAEAYSAKLGPNMQNSNPMRRSSGEAVDSAANSLSPQASASGSFTLFDAVFGGPNTMTKAANAVGDNLCPALLSTEGAVAGGILSAAGLVVSGGGIKAVTTLASKTVTKVAKDLITKGAQKAALSQIKTGGTKTAKLLGTTAKSAGKIAATTVVARAIVASQSGALNNGLEQDIEYAHMVDSGINLQANEISRRQQYGAPLTKEENRRAAAKSLEEFAQANKDKGTFERYFAVSNPRSLVSSFGYAVQGATTNTSLTKFLGSINPASFISRMASSLNTKVNAAEVNLASLSYNNVQWGWTAAEMAKIEKDPTYSQLENWRILDTSGQTETIASKYGKCFTETQGKLFEAGHIVRDEDGNVDPNKGDCAPANLGPSNEMVFRWRVSQADNIDFDEKLNQQVVTEEVGAPGELTGDATEFVLGTYNIKHEENHGGQCQETKNKECAVNRSQAQANIIMGKAGGPAYDIVASQEVAQPQHTRLKEMLVGYEAWPVQVPKDHGLSIYWNTAKFSKLPEGGDGTIDALNNSAQPAKIPWVGLQTASGQKIYVLSVHSPNNNSNGTMKNRAANSRAYLAWARSVKANGGIAVVMGDFNANLNNKGEPEVGHYCILTSDGALQNLYDMSQGRPSSTQCPSKSESRGIDHIYMTPAAGITAENWVHEEYVDTYRFASDHTPVHVKVKMPGSGSTEAGDTGWVWPVSKDSWNGPFGYNVWGSCKVKCRHGGVDLSGTGGDPVLAAHTGKVESVGIVILTRGSCKWQVVVKATGTPYYYAYQHMGTVTVKEGDTVTAGSKMGTVDPVGPTGDCGSGAHLHFSIEKSATVSAYATNASVCDPNQVDCARQMQSLPPLCFLEKEGRNYGSSVPANQTRGSDYCVKVLTGAAST